MDSALKILFLAAEADPFVKIGGLGDVAGSLPRALRAVSPQDSESAIQDADVRLVIPFYEMIQRQAYALQPVATFTISDSSGPIRAEAYQTEINGVPVYLISGAPFREDRQVYSSDNYTDGYKFTFFSLASLELARRLDWSPDILHANDWHTAPAVYSLSLSPDPFFQSTATLIGVHNLPYLGIGAGPALQAFGLPAARGSALPEWAQDLPLPLALLTADHIVAPSPTYAREILTPEFGSGLDDFLKTRSGSISGILNGINTTIWDPSNDRALISNYSAEDLNARKENKAALLKELDLDPDPRVPLFAMVTRMDPQKGVDLVPGALRLVRESPWQAVILGNGVQAIEAAVQQLENEFPERVRAIIRFDTALSHRIYAGSDALLIPSRYEPCGLTQMIAMRYGCVPVARAVGGLRDTIQDFDITEDSTGFLFDRATVAGLAGAIKRAIAVFSNRSSWQSLQRRGMTRDFSWERSAGQYLALYRSLVEQKISSQA